ncbi:unnamed protein product [Cylicocyclus nassatus]|uniref:Uncharacterized protein n=1 Tax=Cylicocyclus nassatus TaxID=53992 RepID=A0AA36MI64_CYLNA|nr:unnamed protein product [Cylicocyclus nassatus]
MSDRIDTEEMTIYLQQDTLTLTTGDHENEREKECRKRRPHHCGRFRNFVERLAPIRVPGSSKCMSQLGGCRDMLSRIGHGAENIRCDEVLLSKDLP